MAWPVRLMSWLARHSATRRSARRASRAEAQRAEARKALRLAEAAGDVAEAQESIRDERRELRQRGTGGISKLPHAAFSI